MRPRARKLHAHKNIYAKVFAKRAQGALGHFIRQSPLNDSTAVKALCRGDEPLSTLLGPEFQSSATRQGLLVSFPTLACSVEEQLKDAARKEEQ